MSVLNLVICHTQWITCTISTSVEKGRKVRINHVLWCAIVNDIQELCETKWLSRAEPPPNSNLLGDGPPALNILATSPEPTYATSRVEPNTPGHLSDEAGVDIFTR